MSDGPPTTPAGSARGSDDPSSRRIAAEIAIFAALFLLAGAAFVLVRVQRQGPSVLSFDPHAAAREDRAGSR